MKHRLRFPIDVTPSNSRVGPDTSPYEIYVMSARSGVKIGVSFNAKVRHAGMRTAVPEPVTLDYWRLGPAHLIRRAEKLAHERLASRRVTGEWFDITSSEAVATVEVILKELGVS